MGPDPLIFFVFCSAFGIKVLSYKIVIHLASMNENNLTTDSMYCQKDATYMLDSKTLMLSWKRTMFPHMLNIG